MSRENRRPFENGEQRKLRNKRFGGSFASAVTIVTDYEKLEVECAISRPLRLIIRFILKSSLLQ